MYDTDCANAGSACVACAPPCIAIAAGKILRAVVCCGQPPAHRRPAFHSPQIQQQEGVAQGYEFRVEFGQHDGREAIENLRRLRAVNFRRGAVWQEATAMRYTARRRLGFWCCASRRPSNMAPSLQGESVGHSMSSKSGQLRLRLGLEGQQRFALARASFLSLVGGVRACTVRSVADCAR